MKRTLVFLAALMMLTSCFKDQKNTLNYLLQASFDYNLSALEVQDTFKDSLMIANLQGGKAVAFGWQDLAFCFKADPSKTIIGGCAASYSRDYVAYDDITEETSFPKYWSVYEDKTYKEPEKKDENATKADDRKIILPNGFLLFHANPDKTQMPEHDIFFPRTQYGSCTMTACLINNTAQVVKAIKMNNFQKGDYIKVTATGYLDDKETGKAEIFLAEFNEEKSFVMKDWTKFDLAKLGDIDYIDLDWESNRPEIQPYFCLDMITAAVALAF